jgi:hypothetical protein
VEKRCQIVVSQFEGAEFDRANVKPPVQTLGQCIFWKIWKRLPRAGRSTATFTASCALTRHPAYSLQYLQELSLK